MQTGAAQWAMLTARSHGPTCQVRSGQATVTGRFQVCLVAKPLAASQAGSRRGLPSVGNLRNLSSWQRLGTSKWPAQPLRRPRTGVCRTARGAGAIIAAIDST
jgi:hypothetical protein